MKKREVITWKIPFEKEGWTLLSFLRKEFSLSYKIARRLLEKGLCRINGHIEQFGSYSLKKHDCIEIEKNWQDYITPPVVPRPHVLYEDEACLIIDKPIEMLCEDQSLHRFFSSKYSFVHRLDRMTSGAVIIAKSTKMKNSLISLFRMQKVEKYYLVFVDGYFKEEKGKIENFLMKKQTHPPIWGSVKKGLYALTLWRCLKRIEDASLVLCRIVTGRTHQLRVHFSEMGHPILGDYLYAKSFRYPLYLPRIMLHSLAVSFVHPFSQKKIYVQAPLPKEFYQLSKNIILPKPLVV